MSLRKNIDKVSHVSAESNISLQEKIKLEKFSNLITDVAIYLLESCRKHAKEDSCITLSRFKCPTCDDFMHKICIASGEGNCSNVYVKQLVETIFVKSLDFYVSGVREGTPIKFNGTSPYDDDDELWDVIDSKFSQWPEEYPYVWRADLVCDRKHTRILHKIIEYILSEDDRNFSSWYIIFWNLFLTALDDEIYNNQLSSVIDLAYILHFDEHMIRDWCRAVEYVLTGNRLSKGCDLHCDTVEGAGFFLRDEKCLNKLWKSKN